jgi:flagellar protein FlbD
MVYLTGLNGTEVLLNADLVEIIQETPDCLITLTTGRKIMVRESMEEVREKILVYRKTLGRAYPVPAGPYDDDAEEIVDH